MKRKARRSPLEYPRNEYFQSQMRIVFTSYVHSPGFTDPLSWLDRTRFYGGVLEALAKEHEVHSLEQIGYSGKLNRNGVHYHFLEKALFSTAEQHRRIVRLKPDVVMVHGLLFPVQLIRLRRTVGSAARIVVQHHAEQPLRGIKALAQRFADRFVDKYLFTSGALAEPWLRAKLIAKKEKIAEVMEGSSFFRPVPRDAARAATRIEGDPALLWVGRLNANKDPLSVVEGFMRFKRTRPGARLFMIYHTRELLDAVNQVPGVQDGVHLIGEVAHGSMDAWYSAADFFVSGSHYEGSGIALCEAMSCGCIPIVTDIPSFRKMTMDGSYGLLYEKGNPRSLAEALGKACSLDVTIVRQQVLEHFRKELSFDAIAARMGRVLKNLHAKS